MEPVSLPVILNVLDSFGLLNIAALMCILNSPSLILTIYSNSGLKAKLKEEYVTATHYEKNQEKLYNDVLVPLKKVISDLSLTIQQHRIDNETTKIVIGHIQNELKHRGT